jgi:hypothetical protein
LHSGKHWFRETAKPGAGLRSGQSGRLIGSVNFNGKGKILWPEVPHDRERNLDVGRTKALRCAMAALTGKMIRVRYILPVKCLSWSSANLPA